MTKRTVHAQLRAAQDILNQLNQLLESAREHARADHLAPIHIETLSRAIDFNQTVWNDLNVVATRLELTAGPFKRSTRSVIRHVEV